MFAAVSETIKQSELRNNNAEIMRRVVVGESFTVTVHGRPVADLVPHQRLGHRRRRLVPAAEFDEMLADLSPLNVEQWKRDREQGPVVVGDPGKDLPGLNAESGEVLQFDTGGHRLVKGGTGEPLAEDRSGVGSGL
ncbi:MAG: type II toxin-antitoxin system Phd/YefM family antitoxin [Pseudonocardiaceae bacterium]